MTCRGLAVGLFALMGACSAPDYTPVRDWARSASIAADYPAAAPADDGVAAMQEALVVWLSALGVMADDGVLPYPEDPFLTVAPRAAAVDARGGEAVAALGRTLRHATRNNLQAPALRDMIRGGDPAVQVLVAALSDAVARRAAVLALPADTPAERYRALLAQVGAGHALLKDKAGEITGAETVQRIRAAEDQLRRAARALPLPSQPVAAP
jgi:hypothetical protein